MPGSKGHAGDEAGRDRVSSDGAPSARRDRLKPPDSRCVWESVADHDRARDVVAGTHTRRAASVCACRARAGRGDGAGPTLDTSRIHAMRVSLNTRTLFAALALSTAAAAPLHARPVAPAPVAAETTLVAPTPAARWVGVYRIMLSEKKDGAMIDARVLIEPNGQQLMGMLMVDQHASGITDVKVEN